MPTLTPAPAIVITQGLLDSENAKSAHGLIRGSERFVVKAIIDGPETAGRDAGDVLDGRSVGIPVYADLDAYLAATPAAERAEYCCVGVALSGGSLPAEFRATLLQAAGEGMNLVNGLHTFLSEDDEFIAAAEAGGGQLIDIRKPRHRKELKFWSGKILDLKIPRIAVLGSDCAVGKRTTTRWLRDGCRKAGLKTEMIYTGQTGWMQGSPYGFILDSTVNDFVSGEIERAILECAEEAEPDLILLEGQSALRNPTGPCGSEMLLSGGARGVILQHDPSHEVYKGTSVKMGSLAAEVGLIRMYGSEVIAVCLTESKVPADKLQRLRTEYAADLGVPVIMPWSDGIDELVQLTLDYVKKGA